MNCGCHQGKSEWSPGKKNFVNSCWSTHEISVDQLMKSHVVNSCYSTNFMNSKLCSYEISCCSTTLFIHQFLSPGAEGLDSHRFQVAQLPLNAFENGAVLGRGAGATGAADQRTETLNLEALQTAELRTSMTPFYTSSRLHPDFIYPSSMLYLFFGACYFVNFHGCCWLMLMLGGCYFVNFHGYCWLMLMRFSMLFSNWDISFSASQLLEQLFSFFSSLFNVFSLFFHLFSSLFFLFSYLFFLSSPSPGTQTEGDCSMAERLGVSLLSNRPINALPMPGPDLTGWKSTSFTIFRTCIQCLRTRYDVQNRVVACIRLQF